MGPILLYDGTCGLCDASVQFVLACDRAGVFRFAALHSAAASRALESFGGRPADLTTFYLIDGPRLRTRADAALAVAHALGWPWWLAGALRIVPLAWLDRVYDFVARHRHRVFGGAQACRVPRPEERARFLDAEERGSP